MKNSIAWEGKTRIWREEWKMVGAWQKRIDTSLNNSKEELESWNIKTKS